MTTRPKAFTEMDRVRPQPRGASRWNGFLLSHKGDLTLAFSVFVYAVAWAAWRLTPWRTPAEIAVSMAEAALIGGLCDYIALKMIFERRWYLPGSGVLPRNRVRLIDGIAATIENEWLTPEMIENKLNEMNLVGQIGSFLEEVKLDTLLAEPGIERMLNRIASYLESPEVLGRLEGFLRKVLPKTFTRLYAVLNRVGLRSMSAQVASNLRKRLPEIRRDPELMATLESAVHELGQQLHDPQSPAHELAGRLIDLLVRRAVAASRGQIALMVKENLRKLSDERIKFQIESKTRTHLDWIRVNGGIFGALFGLAFALSRILAHHGTALIARLQLAL